MRKAAIIGLVVSVLLVSLLVPKAEVLGAQYNPPWAHRFTFHYPGVDSTTFDSTWLALVGGGAGYNASAWQDRPVTGAAAVLPDDAVFSFRGHGVILDGRPGGYVVFWDGSSYSDLRAAHSMPPLPISSLSRALEDVSDLWDLRFMCLVACYSACAPYEWNTSLTVRAMMMGTDCALGFYDEIWVFPENDWALVFWISLCAYSQTVQYAAEVAADYVYDLYGDYFGWNTHAVFGEPTTIRPAGYGN